MLLGLGCVVPLSPFLRAQTVHQLPFASSQNTVELTVANESTVPLTRLAIHLSSAPSWVLVAQPKQSLALLKPRQELPVLFSFSVDKSAPVNKEERLVFTISTEEGEQRIKEIRIVVTPPERIELFPNYPNPFNPTTTLSYQLPMPAKVTLKVFNLLGQEVATLIDEEQRAGYHQSTWSAAHAASGVYVAQLVATTVDGAHWTMRRAMVLLR
jgi:hypothetical protein